MRPYHTEQGELISLINNNKYLFSNKKRIRQEICLQPNAHNSPNMNSNILEKNTFSRQARIKS